MTSDDKALVGRLLPCPFCGGEPKVFHHQNKWVGETWHIECLDDNCGCGTCHHESAEIAATVWNRRIEAQAAEIERLERSRSAWEDEARRYAGNSEYWQTETERLREALGWFLNDSRFVVQVGGNPNAVPQMIEAARAALGETE